MKKKRLISLLLAAFITVMPLSFSFAAPTPEPTADNTTSTVTSPDGTTRTVTSDGNDVKSTPKATESTDTSSDTETTSATKTPSDTSSDTSSTSDTTLQSDTDTTSQNANSLPDGVTMEDPSLTPRTCSMHSPHFLWTWRRDEFYTAKTLMKEFTLQVQQRL